MNPSKKVIFRRIRGKLVPIMVAKEAVKTTAGTGIAAYVRKNVHPKKEVTPHMGLAALGVASAVASGALSAATLFSSGRGMVAGAGGSFALDVLSTSANIGSFARSKGSNKDKVKSAAKMEAFNTLLGNGVFVGGLLAFPSTRKKVFTGVTTALSKLRSFL